MTLRHILVAVDDDEVARNVLWTAGDLARRTAARLTVAHVAPVADEVIDECRELQVELLAAREDVRCLQRLVGLAAVTAPGVKRDVRVLRGSPSEQLLALIRRERPDLVVAGSGGRRRVRRLLTLCVRNTLLARVSCPVMLVRDRLDPVRAGVVLACSAGVPRGRAEAVAVGLAAGLGWQLVRHRSARGCRPSDLLRACHEQRASLAVVEIERHHALSSRIAQSETAKLLDGAPCPVVVVPRFGSAPIVGPEPLMTVPRMRLRRSPLSRHSDDSSRTASNGSNRSRRRSLLWQLFTANGLVLAGATAALILSPVSVSRDVVLAEVLVLAAGLGVMLAINLAVLGRTLAPLRVLADVMGDVDPRRPGRRLPLTQMRGVEVRALAEAFNAMLDRLENERRQSALRALAAQEDERVRIAREMHDQVGQTLTAVTLQAERAARMEGPVDRELLEQIARTALQSLDDVRRIGRELRPEALDDLGLGNALISLCRRLSAQSGVRIVPALESGVPRLPAEMELVVYRIAQEAITNALRHAEASCVDLKLRCASEVLELAVSDDGVGMPPSARNESTGIAGMHERALLVGGTLRIESSAGYGTAVTLSIPLSGAAS